MITVIKHGNTKKMGCPVCNCVFTYDAVDIEHKATSLNGFNNFVRCQDCGAECKSEDYYD